MDKDISYVAFESVCARFERTIKRLWITIIILTVFLVGTNCAWLYYENQFEEVTTTTTEVTQDAQTDDGGDVVLNGIGDMNYGEGDTDN